MSPNNTDFLAYGTDLGLPVVDQEVFRNVVGHFATGVTVIGARDGEASFGTTASAVSSLSMDPPMMLICLNRTSSTHDAVVRSGRYSINILAADQGSLARHFARKSDDKFAGIAHEISDHNLPRLDDALATIECVVDESAVGGTHTIFLGRVLHAQAREGEPLAYYRGTFGTLGRAQEAAAYEGTRDWVLRRRTPLGVRINAEELAGSLRTDPVLVNNALIRLTAQSLVRRESDGTLTPTPMTAGLVDGLYNARIAIETGVIESYLGSTSDERVARIRALNDSILNQTPSSTEDLDAFLELNQEYHVEIVNAAGSAQLTDSYRELNVSTVWRETFDATTWEHQLGNAFLPRITAAIESRDVEAAKTAVRDQVAFILEGAKEVIAARGGAV